MKQCSATYAHQKAYYVSKAAYFRVKFAHSLYMNIYIQTIKWNLLFTHKLSYFDDRIEGSWIRDSHVHKFRDVDKKWKQTISNEPIKPFWIQIWITVVYQHQHCLVTDWSWKSKNRFPSSVPNCGAIFSTTSNAKFGPARNVINSKHFSPNVETSKFFGRQTKAPMDAEYTVEIIKSLL